MTTIPRANLLVSFVIATRNRRDVLLKTIAQVRRCGLHGDAFEILIVDNASTDGTCDVIAGQYPDVRLFPLSHNLGSCGKNVALAQAGGRFVVILDDDAYPQSGSIARMIRHFECDARLGAAVFDVALPDGSRECSAYPNVFIGCGTGFRRRALAEVGGLPTDFFMQAEEYDLSLRLLDGGWNVRSFDDLHVTHLKSPQARLTRRTMRLDVRNNILLAHRRFPKQWSKECLNDWLRRYWLIASANRQRLPFLLGAAQGFLRTLRDRDCAPVSATTFECFAKFDEVESRLRAAQDLFDLQSVLFIDLGKAILPYWRAANKLGIKVVAIADERLGGFKAHYRGVPIERDDEARTYAFDAAIVSNLSTAHAAARRGHWRAQEARPVIDLFESEAYASPTRGITSAGPAESESRRIAARTA